MRTGPYILCLGNDAQLLEIRCRVFATRYRGDCERYGSPASQEKLDAASGYNVLVLCHSLSREECNTIAARFRQANATAPIISLTAPGTYGTAEDSDAVVAALAGPGALLTVIADVLPPEPAQSTSSAI